MLSSFALGALLFAAPPVESEPREIEAVRATTPPKIDGKGEDEVWERAPVDDRFVERQPELGAEPPVRTTVQVAYDDKYLYFYLEAEQDPDTILIRALRRDNFAIFADDTIGIKIDPFNDKRTAINFAVNAAGAQLDILSLEDGRVGRSEWDAVWSAETTITDKGWTAEYRIPFAALGIKGGNSLAMGLDVTRDHQERNATYDWRLIIPPRSPTAASTFGTLTGLEGIAGGRAIELIPYALGRTDFTNNFTLDPRRTPNVAVGGDVRVQIGKGSYIEGSVLTDFAQVEADQVQVAQDRFPLFFPERRPFFINGLDVFNFGRSGSSQLFFSRRIGLDGGRPIPVAAGVKAYGRAGPVSYGLLQVQTLSSFDANDPSQRLSTPENFTVARVRVQPGQYFSVGILGLGKHRFLEEDQDVFSGGVDAELRALGGKLNWYSFLAATWRQIPGEEAELDDEGLILNPGTPARDKIGASGFTGLNYQGLFVRPFAEILWSDRDFQAPLGFYRRPGVAQHNWGIEFAPRPTVLGLREIAFGPRWGLTTEPDYSGLLTFDTGSFVSFRWRNGWRVSADAGYRDDLVQNPFRLYQYTIDAKRYRGLRGGINMGTPSNKAVSLGMGYGVSNLFNGLSNQFNVNGQVRFGRHLSINGSYTHLFGQLEDQDESFNFGFANAGAEVSFTRNITWDTLVRYSLEPGSERVGLQSRFRWRYLPGSDLFVVYRSNIPFAGAPVGEDLPQQFHSVVLKIAFYFRTIASRRRPKT